MVAIRSKALLPVLWLTRHFLGPWDYVGCLQLLTLLESLREELPDGLLFKAT